MIPMSCDTMVALGTATRNGQTLFAKNSDRPASECQPLVQYPRQEHAASAALQCQFVSMPQAGTTYRHVGSRPYWCWGYEHGFNEYQVVIGNEALPSRLEEARQGRLVGMEVLRLGLERGRTAAQAVEVMTDLISRYGQGKFANSADVRTYDNDYIVADPREAYVIETAGHEWAVQKVEGTCGISNVYSVETAWVALSSQAEDVACEAGWWTSDGRKFNFADAFTKDSRAEGSGAMRRRRSSAMLRQRQGDIEAPTMMALLGDHGDGENPDEPFQTQISTSTSICVHGNIDGTGGNTAASLVADLCSDGSRLAVYWCSMYSPCLGVFMPLFCEGAVPGVLGIGGETPSESSPWWLFHRLSCLARTAAEERVPLVRARWAQLQADFFASAYEIARQGRDLIDKGRTEEAERKLAEYMRGNVEVVLQSVGEMIEEFQEVPEGVPAT